MYFAAVVVMSTLERVRMEFNCYDVLEVHGSRYVITEKIKYIEIIPKADKEQSYRGQPSMTKSPGDYWHEYGLEAVEGIDKIWLTIDSMHQHARSSYIWLCYRQWYRFNNT